MSDWGNQEPVRLMNFREWVSDSARFWLYICFLAVFQFSNGFYFTTMEQVVGDRTGTYQCSVPVRTLLSTVAAIVLCRRFVPPVRHIRVLL